jgi:nitroreductase
LIERQKAFYGIDDMEVWHMLDLIKKRRSIRRYTDQDLTDEQIQQLMEAAMAAPSGHNRQPWSFIIVKDAQLKQKLAETHQYAKMAATAPVVIVVCSDTAISADMWLEDASAATENMLLQASAMGLGAVWVGMQYTPDWQVYARDLLNIPDSVQVVCIVPIGYPAEERAPKTKYNPARVFYEVYGATKD